MPRPVALTLSLTAYVLAVVFANLLSAHYGMVHVLGTSLLVSAGTYAAGFALLARDFVHRYGGAAIAVAAILAAGALSWHYSTPALAVASTLAFLAGELVDLGVFAPLRNRAGFAPAALMSNIVAAPVDTVAFLALAGFPLTLESVTGQLIGKVLWATLVPLALWLLVTRSARMEARA